MKKEQIPENAIDKFFYKIGRSFKNIGITIKDSEVINKTFGRLLFGGPWAVIVWYILLAVVVGYIVSKFN